MALAFIPWNYLELFTYDISTGTLTASSGNGGFGSKGYASGVQVASGAMSVQMTLAATPGANRIIGISRVSSNASLAYAGCNFGMYHFQSTIYYLENGNVGFLSNIQAGDVVGVRVTATGTVEYFRNGVVFRTVTNPGTLLQYPINPVVFQEITGSIVATQYDVPVTSANIPTTAIFDDDSIFVANTITEKPTQALFEDDVIFTAAPISDISTTAIFDDDLIFDAAVITGIATTEIFDDALVFDVDPITQADLSISTIFDDDLDFTVIPGPVVIPAVPFFPPSVLEIQIDSRPATAHERQFHDHLLTVGGVEVELKSFSVSEEESRLGRTFNFALLNPDDKSLFVPNARIILRLYDEPEQNNSYSGRPISETLIDTNDLSSTSYNISATDENFSLVISDNPDAPWNKTPATDLVLYDPNRVEVTPEEFPIRRDTAGNIYATALYAYEALSFYKILDFIVRQCDLDGFEAGAFPDYLITRINFQMGISYLDAIRPLLGVRRARVAIKNNKLVVRPYVRKKSTVMPPIRTLTVDDYLEMQIGRNIPRISGYKLIYSHNELESSFYRPRTVTTTSPSGLEIMEITWHDYYAIANPSVTTLSVVARRKTITKDSLGNTIGDLRETFTYDWFGKEIQSSSETRTMIPNLLDPSGNAPLMLLLARDTSTVTKYKTHPFKKNSQYKSSSSVIVSGAIATDAVKLDLYDQPFEQPLLEALEAGNVTKEMGVRYGAIRSVFDYFFPQKNGQVSVLRMPVNHIKNNLGASQSEAQDAEIATPTRAVNEEIFVFLPDRPFNGQPLEDYFGGELPIYQLIEIATIDLQRKIDGRDRNFSISIAGRDRNLDQGSEITLKDKNGNSLADVLVTGWTYSWNGSDGTYITSLTMEEF